ncbi:MAG: glycosyltransferase family 4 protein [Candidatus Dormibacteria bacterium]
MEIGIDASRAFQREATGIGVYATQVILGLLREPPAPLRLYLNRRLPPTDPPSLPAGAEWRCMPLARGWTALRLRWELRSNPPTLLWVPAYRLPGGRLPRSVVTIHGVEHRFAKGAYPPRQAAAVEAFVVDTLVRSARVITPSETTRADLVHLYGADPQRITVIPHGVGSQLRPLPPERRAPLLRQLGVGSPYFLAVGAHHPRKAIGFLLQRFAHAFPEGLSTGPRLVVTNASGEVGRTLRALVQQLGLERRVTTLGHVSGERLAALMGGAVAVCVPSLYEGFGLPALEAMACGAPVLARGVGGVQEVAEGAALLVEGDDEQGWVEGLRRLLEDAELRSHLGRLGLERASRYTWERSVELHASLLKEELRLAQLAVGR